MCSDPRSGAQVFTFMKKSDPLTMRHKWPTRDPLKVSHAWHQTPSSPEKWPTKSGSLALEQNIMLRRRYLPFSWFVCSVVRSSVHLSFRNFVSVRCSLLCPFSPLRVSFLSCSVPPLLVFLVFVLFLCCIVFLVFLFIVHGLSFLCVVWTPVCGVQESVL